MKYNQRSIQRAFFSIYKIKPVIITNAPGRAEIIGCHTDYNHGYAIGAAISQNSIAAVAKRNDDLILAYSDTFDKKPSVFRLTEIHKKKGHHWTNYVKAIIWQFNKLKPIKKGFNLMVMSNIPSSGGVSSSAALELAVGLSLAKLYNIKLTKLELAILCQKAENGPLVNSPCGFLDQATSSLSRKNNLLFLDFLPQKNIPISKYEYIPIDLEVYDLSFLIIVDKNIRRNLGVSGYPKRRKMCERSLPILSKLLKRKIKSLREVSVSEFKKCKKDLGKIDKKMRMCVEHIVYENQRVLDAVEALKIKDIKLFGKLMTLSGISSLDLYELDEKTPELTFLLDRARKEKGVIGARNMGGGFSANILVLIKNPFINKFITRLSFLYKKKYNNKLDFILFRPQGGAKIQGALWQSK